MIKLSEFITYSEIEEYGKDKSIFLKLRKDVIENFNNELLEGTAHPIHYYVRFDLNKDSDDSVYDILNDEWVKNPLIVPDNFVEEKYPDVYKEADKIAKSLDISLGNVKRDILDYNYLSKQLNLVDNKEKIEKYLKEKLDSIDSDLKNLLSEFNIVRDKRKSVFSNDEKELKETWTDSPNWSPSNISYKLLEKWQYITLLNSINRIYSNESVPLSDRVNEISTLLKLSNTVAAVEGDGIPEASSLYTRCLDTAFRISVQDSAGAYTGSGFLISQDGYALTCAHVINGKLSPPIDPNLKISGSFDGESEVAIKIIAMNYDIDAALIKIDNVDNIEPLKIGTAQDFLPGDPVLVASSPIGVHDIVTTGIISSTIRDLQEDLPVETISPPIFFIDVDISPGSSGGMLVSESTGEIIGIARGSAVEEDADSIEHGSLNYVVSIDAVKDWLYSINEVHFTEDRVKTASNKIEVDSYVAPNDKLVEVCKKSDNKYMKQLVEDGTKIGRVVDIIGNNCLVNFDEFNLIIPKKKLIFSGYAGKPNNKKAKTHIEVNRKDKKLKVIRNGKDIFNCIVSIGAPETPSYGGFYKIIDKETNPFEEYFDQYLPFWMGFNEFYNIETDQGCFQGIHSIPLDKNKKQIPDKIGEENSHGCIRLEYNDAKKLYKIIKLNDTIELK